MIRVGVTGLNSSITQSFIKHFEECAVIDKVIDRGDFDCDIYFLAAGVLDARAAHQQDDEQMAHAMHVNCTKAIRFMDTLFEVNNTAKVCIIGSMSGVKGSFNMIYAAAKAGVHVYVEKKRLWHKDQHLVCVAPTVIEDTNMTQTRHDLAEVRKRTLGRRLGRWLKAKEVSDVAHFALNQPSMCNTVICLTGGNW